VQLGTAVEEYFCLQVELHRCYGHSLPQQLLEQRPPFLALLPHAALRVHPQGGHP